MNALKVSGIYFAVVFAAGFVLGSVRVFWLVPSLGTRVAELGEAPIMLVVTILAARWLVRRHREITAARDWLVIGLFAFGWMILVEFTVVLWLRGLSLAELNLHAITAPPLELRQPSRQPAQPVRRQKQVNLRLQHRLPLSLPQVDAESRLAEHGTLLAEPRYAEARVMRS